MIRLFEPEPETSGQRKAGKTMSRPKQSILVIPPGNDPGGDTPFERFDNIMKRILSTPKEEVDRRMAASAKLRKKATRRRAISAKAADSDSH
jgi:hypothetical protein